MNLRGDHGLHSLTSQRKPQICAHFGPPSTLGVGRIQNSGCCFAPSLHSTHVAVKGPIWKVFCQIGRQRYPLCCRMTHKPNWSQSPPIFKSANVPCLNPIGRETWTAHGDWKGEPDRRAREEQIRRHINDTGRLIFRWATEAAGINLGLLYRRACYEQRRRVIPASFLLAARSI